MYRHTLKELGICFSLFLLSTIENEHLQEYDLEKYYMILVRIYKRCGKWKTSCGEGQKLGQLSWATDRKGNHVHSNQLAGVAHPHRESDA